MISISLPVFISCMLILLLIGFRRGRTAYERKLVRLHKLHTRALELSLQDHAKKVAKAAK
jgi:hypothetical protein